jgi:hypothetical protein
VVVAVGGRGAWRLALLLSVVAVVSFVVGYVAVGRFVG